MITSPSLVFAADIKSSDDNEEKQSSDNDKSSSEEDKGEGGHHDDCDKIRPGWNKNYYNNKCKHDNDK